MRKIVTALALASACAITPVAAQVIPSTLGIIVVPPTQTFTPGFSFVQAGPGSGADISFIISQAMTLTRSSFTNSTIGNTGTFDFTSAGLFQGIGTGGTLLQAGTVSTFDGERRASIPLFNLDPGSYTISFRGTVSGPPAGVGGSIVFAAGDTPAVPEPASWAMMIGGFGVVGALMRRGKRTTRVRFA